MTATQREDSSANATRGPAAGATGGTAGAPTPNADDSELGKFDALSHRFWDPLGEFRPLHVLNPVRARFVSERTQLAAARVLDVGCGGGLLCEAFARAGAKVTGIDLAPGMVEVAKLHAMEQGLAIDYRMADADRLGAADAVGVPSMADTPPARPSMAGRSVLRTSPTAFDVVTSMEMLEHVPDPARMMATLARLVRPNGNVFVSTVNRNLKSFLTAIVGAEYVLRLIPRGTHEYERLIQPAELARWGRAVGLELAELAGIDYNPVSHTATLTRDPSVNYLAHFVRR